MPTMKAAAADFNEKSVGRMVHAVDVSDQSATEGMVDAAVGRFGRLDVLVNNAGVAPTEPLLEASVADWRKVMAVDVDGVFFCARAPRAMPGFG